MERKKARITVLKRMDNRAVQEAHQAEGRRFGPCGFLKDGQEWIVGSQAPDDFCHWAWADIHADVVMVQCGGNPGYIGPDHTMISCCCDGLRPVVFCVERVDEIERLEEPC
jgi:uncharacterized repeat protein (TIGR04076 family)